jgi:hypothetical protein
MKSLIGYPQTLQTYQARLNYLPLVRLVLTSGATTHTFTTRILDVDEEQTPFSQKVKVVLENRDLALDSLDLKGYSAVLSYGLKTNAGWSTWLPNTAYSLGDRVVPSTKNGYRYICSHAGTSDPGTYVYTQYANHGGSITHNFELGLPTQLYLGQSFIPASTHNLGKLTIKAQRGGNPGTLTIEIRAVDINGKPTGSVLGSTTYNANTISNSTFETVELLFSTLVNLNSGNKYGYTLHCSAADPSNYLMVAGNQSGYSGDIVYSADGINWNLDNLTDFIFEDFGRETVYTEPTWPTTPGATVTDGSVTWTNDGKENEIYLETDPLTVIGQDLASSNKSGLRDHVLTLQGTPNDLMDDKASDAYLPPPARLKWKNATHYNLNEKILSSDPNGVIYKCTQAGTSGATEPAFDDTLGVEYNDNTVKWVSVKNKTVKDFIVDFLTSVSPYETWVKSTPYSQGDYVIPITPTGYVYKCVKSGISGTPSSPSFHPTLGEEYTDGTTAWICERRDNPFSHCKVYTVTFDSEDGLIDMYIPSSFRFSARSSRLSVIKKLLNYTGCAMKYTSGAIHIFVPNVDTVEYEYSLEHGKHTFYSKTYRQRLVIPNHVTVQSQAQDDPQYSGTAHDSSYHLIPKLDFYFMKLESDTQAAQIAQAMIQRHQLESKGGSGEASLNIGTEIYDYVSVRDPKESGLIYGNIGWFHRKYSIIDKSWIISFGFGGWANTNSLMSQIELDNEVSFDALKVNNLYAGTISADEIDVTWIDPDGNIDLSKIGDNLDNLLDGSTYGRVKSVNIDANGLILLDACVGDLDDIANGASYGKILLTDISAGHIKLTTSTAVSGKWYNSAGVVIDSTEGIIVYGSATAFRTRATELGADQCYMDAAGAICAGAGNVKLDADGIKFYGTGRAKFYYSATQVGLIDMTNNGLYVESDNGKNLYFISDADIYMHSDHFDLTLSGYLSSVGGSFSDRLVIPAFSATDVVEGALAYGNSFDGSLYVYHDSVWYRHDPDA